MNYEALDPIQREERRKRLQAEAVRRWKQQNRERINAQRRAKRKAKSS